LNLTAASDTICEHINIVLDYLPPVRDLRESAGGNQMKYHVSACFDPHLNLAASALWCALQDYSMTPTVVHSPEYKPLVVGAVTTLFADLERTIVEYEFGLNGEQKWYYELSHLLDLPTYDFLGFHIWSLNRIGDYLLAKSAMRAVAEKQSYAPRLDICSIDDGTAYTELDVTMFSSARIWNRLCNEAGFRITFGMLVASTRERVEDIIGLGNLSVDEIESILHKRNLRFATPIELP
jgi:hypothetical protein